MGLLILGTGGHAKVALDIALESGIEVAGFLDDNPARHGHEIHGVPIMGPLSCWKDHGDLLFPAIGDNRARARVSQMDASWATLIHPRATVSRFAVVGTGVLIAFGACIGPDARVGDFSIVNSGATVDHDCTLDPFVHIAVGSHLAGNVHVCQGAFLGAGAIVIPNLEIGEWSVVGAGATVIKAVKSGETVVGTPAKPQ